MLAPNDETPVGDLLIRDLPDPTHAELKRRAAAAGMSMQTYVSDLLEQHTATPTLAQWLASLRDRTPHPDLSGAEAVRAGRRDDGA